MNRRLIDFFEWQGFSAQYSHKEQKIRFGPNEVSVENGIPRFTSTESYSSGNFSRLRKEHATLQLDSVNGTTDRYDTILERTQWPASFFRDKVVLECGCGAGPDTEILLKLGATVLAVDIAGIDIAKDNLGSNDRLQLVQASITDIPLEKGSFDIVFCHRVLQHTPDPAHTLRHILEYVKPDGAVFVHSYARTIWQMARWKYLLRPFTKRMDARRLYDSIKAYSGLAYKITSIIQKMPGGKAVNHVFIPFLNKRHLSKFDRLTEIEIIEYGIHDTFDALSPTYDTPLSASTMRNIAHEALTNPFEVDERKTITLLRTKL